MFLSKCPMCNSKKLKFLKEKEARGLLISLGIRTALKLDSHLPENFFQIKVIPSGVQKNSIICLFGV